MNMHKDAPQYSFVLNSAGDIGVGTDSPASSLHVERNDGTAKLLVEETFVTVEKRFLLDLRNNGAPGFKLLNSDSGDEWQCSQNGRGDFIVSLDRTGGPEFKIYKSGRIRMGTPGADNFDLDPADNLTIGGNLTQNSDVNTKMNFTAVNGKEVLTRLQELPISTWNLKKDDTEARHLGPMAQDFYKAFGLGADDRHIAPMDAAGVALAGIKELQAIVKGCSDS